MTVDKLTLRSVSIEVEVVSLTFLSLSLTSMAVPTRGTEDSGFDDVLPLAMRVLMTVGRCCGCLETLEYALFILVKMRTYRS